MNKKLQYAIFLSKKGDKDQAREILRELVDEDHQLITAWFWLVDTMQTEEERIAVLEEACLHHPEDERLMSALQRLREENSMGLPQEEIPESSIDEETQAEDWEEAFSEESESLDEFGAVFSDQVAVDYFGEDTEEDNPPSNSLKPTANKNSQFLFILFVLLIATLAVAWIFRDSLMTFLPGYESPVVAVPTEEPELLIDTPTMTLEPTNIATRTATATPIVPTETKPVSGPGGTATPILITTPTNTAVVEEGKFISVPGSQINDISWSADGDFFAVAGDAGITIYNGETFTEKTHITLDPIIPVLTVTFSSDNKYIAAGFDQAQSGEELITRAKMWQVNDGAEVMSFDYSAPRGDINALAFSTDGETLLMNAQLDVVLKWRVSDGVLLDVFMLSASEVDYYGVGFSPDRLSFATYSKFDRVRIYDTLFGEQTAVLGETKDIQNVAFSANSQYLAVMFEEQPFVYLWDLPSKARIKEWNTFDGNVTALAFDADNQTLAVCTDEDLIKFYQIRTGEEQRVISRQIPGVFEMEFAPDDILFAVRNETEIQVWHLLTDTLVATFRVQD